jgi:tRNA nucleotidyltransferase (CCA-adding enzyme)
VEPEAVLNVRHIAEGVRAAGGRALVVGGWVRDRLLGRESKDIDIEVFGVKADRLRALLEALGRVETVGESFQVYKFGDIDVSLPRRESKSGHGHGTFPDDSLRVLRAVQFAARFGFELDRQARALCGAIPLDDLPPERIWGEIEKLLSAPRPSTGFALALELGAIEKLFPELHALVGCPQEPEWHPEGDVWVHTLQVIDQARTRVDDLRRPERIVMMLGAVCHDFGKPATTAFVDGRIRSIDHEEQGVAPATVFLDRLNLRSIDGYDVRRQVLGLVAQHLKPGMWFKGRTEVGDGAFRRLSQKVDLELLARLAKADCLGRVPGTFNCDAMDWFLERARSLGVERRPPAPILLGRHLLELGLQPGPRVGEILRAVYEQQLDGTVTTLDEAMTAAKSIV